MIQQKTYSHSENFCTIKLMAKPESNFWSQVKKNLKQFQWVRLESWATQGVPDLLGTTSAGKFFTVELKVSKSKKVKLSPHQISFHKSRPESPSFILVKTSGKARPKNLRCSLFPRPMLMISSRTACHFRL